MLLFHLLLAIAWMALTGHVTPGNLLAGLLLGYLVLWLTHNAWGSRRYVSRVPQALRFALFFLWELLRANVQVAVLVLSPLHRLRPAVVAIPLAAQTDTEITMLANLITLTPGTLSLDVSADRRFLYVHVMHITDLEQFRRDTAALERLLLEVSR